MMIHIILESSNNFMQGILNQLFIMLKYGCKDDYRLMNKLTIPSILAATILIAGIFAFMPVEKAATVHTSLQEAIGTEVTMVKKGISLNPGVDESMTSTIFATTAGTTWRGHMEIVAIAPTGTDAQTIEVNCEVNPEVNSVLLEPTVGDVDASFNFACASLSVTVTDLGTTDDPATVFDAIAQAHVSKTVTTEIE